MTPSERIEKVTAILKARMADWGTIHDQMPNGKNKELWAEKIKVTREIIALLNNIQYLEDTADIWGV